MIWTISALNRGDIEGVSGKSLEKLILGELSQSAVADFEKRAQTHSNGDFGTTVQSILSIINLMRFYAIWLILWF